MITVYFKKASGLAPYEFEDSIEFASTENFIHLPKTKQWIPWTSVIKTVETVPNYPANFVAAAPFYETQVVLIEGELITIKAYIDMGKHLVMLRTLTEIIRIPVSNVSCINYRI